MPDGIKELVNLPAGSSFRLLSWDRNLREVYRLVSTGKSERIYGEGDHWHYHQALELTYFRQGRGTRFVGDRIQEFGAGEIVLLGENLPHYWHAVGGSSGMAVQFFFPPSHPIWVFPEATELVALSSRASRGLQFFGPTAERLIEDLEMMGRVDGLDRVGQLLRLLSRVSQAPSAETSPISNQTFSLSAETGHQTAMRAAMRFLLTHYQEEIRLAQLLEVTRMSKPTFSRYFKQHSGHTLEKCLQQIRIKAACRELSETEKPVIDIALNSGFSQISFFNRVFQRVMRCTPSHYRDYRRKGVGTLGVASGQCQMIRSRDRAVCG
ncbi:MAG TPA: AraC family transcriptional regulator [Opitutaceae bacterium]|nr:AraC family transcriptional regulator [Opitutaceae bacterium]